jgi:hypothetical protein
MYFTTKFLSLRDKMEDDVESGIIAQDHILYEFLERSINYAVGDIRDISLWRMFFKIIFHNKKKIAKSLEKIKSAMEAPENEIYNKYYVEFINVYSKYLITRHTILKFIFLRMLSVGFYNMRIKNCISKLRSSFKNKVSDEFDQLILAKY